MGLEDGAHPAPTQRREHLVTRGHDEPPADLSGGVETRTTGKTVAEVGGVVGLAEGAEHGGKSCRAQGARPPLQRTAERARRRPAGNERYHKRFTARQYGGLGIKKPSGK